MSWQGEKLSFFSQTVDCFFLCKMVVKLPDVQLHPWDQPDGRQGRHHRVRSSVLCIRVFCQRLWRRLRRNVWKSRLRSTKRLFSNLKQQPERLRRYRRSRVWKVREVCQGLLDCWGYCCQEALPAHWGPLDYRTIGNRNALPLKIKLSFRLFRLWIFKLRYCPHWCIMYIIQIVFSFRTPTQILQCKPYKDGSSRPTIVIPNLWPRINLEP